MTPATTTTHPSSDHKVVSSIRLSTEPIDGPKYVKVRNYNKIDKFQFKWDLWYDNDIRQAAIEPDPSVATQLLQRGMLGILDQHAPARIVQTKKQRGFTVSQRTRQLQEAAKTAYDTAVMTKQPENWRQYRSLRNQYTTNIKKDKQRSTNSRLEGQGTNSLWKKVCQMANQRIPGPQSCW